MPGDPRSNPTRFWRNALADLHTWKRRGQVAPHKPLLSLLLIALCAFHHMALNAGALSLSDTLTILVSADITGQMRVDELLRNFTSRPLPPSPFRAMVDKPASPADPTSGSPIVPSALRSSHGERRRAYRGASGTGKKYSNIRRGG